MKDTKIVYILIFSRKDIFYRFDKNQEDLAGVGRGKKQGGRVC